MPDNPFLQGNYAPVHDEQHATPCPITGILPASLVGTLYRNGANPRWPPAEPYHWFTGDGMVHAIHLRDGRAAYANRWVRTPRFDAEQRAGRALFGGFGRPLTPEAEALDTGVANTHVVAHAGRLLALEEAHPPTRLDPTTLHTVGYETFGDALPGRFTAHPKHDPATGQFVFFSYAAAGPFSPEMSWGTVEADGAVSRRELFRAPYCSMVHDFAVTATRIVFPVLPLTGSMDRAVSGRPSFAWDPAAGAFLGVMQRASGAASLVWLPIPPCFFYHVMNAFDDGSALIMDVVEYDRAPLFPHADGSAPAEGSPSRLVRWRIEGGSVAREVLSALPGEFPRMDERYAGSRYRFGYRICAMADGADAIAVEDTEQRTTRILALPPGDRPSEAVFVPRHAGAAEGEGWLLSVVWQASRGGSALWVVDAQRPEAGPVAAVNLPRRVPFGFHGSWVADGAVA